jgi:hypothetical protein
MLISLYSYHISDSCIIGRGYSNGCILNFSTFQEISSTEVGAKIYEGERLVGGLADLFRNGVRRKAYKFSSLWMSYFIND